MESSIEITEVTLRRIICDYVHHRQSYSEKMVWKSEFAPTVVLKLEEKPFSQEGLGYELKDNR